MTHPDATADTVTIALGVDYGQAYLVDECGQAMVPDQPADDDPAHSLGIISVADGVALLTIGTHYGKVRFDVQVTQREPDPDLGSYEDIVEISFDSEAGSVSLREWGDGDVHALPPLPAGPGWYRLRYHVHGLDEGHADYYEEDAPDRYLLQIWSAEECGPRIVKSRSRRHRSWTQAG
ncbi:hypothetical protein [Planobispora takensis]|uniref:Uncharacterized protein n=1 Tax=Planobispora takensis TaxID=1367882 RepID=A0A8J3T2Y3_9ACTN|nr:hypothetical protein [Planobispora takensis]GII03451.1 hypothetical protein Pta02_54590 [Planobispora takensis]